MRATTKTLRCDCGHEVTADGDEELVAAVRAHARDEHGIEFSHEDALLVVLRSELQSQWFDERGASE
jgi:predicted small metal-binding protein